MAAVKPGTERIDGVAATDALQLDAGDGRPVKTATVGEVIGFGWDDLRFPAQGINPIGAASDPAVDTTLADFPGTMLFAGNAENIVAGIAQMPHAWQPGTTIKPHIHWSKPTGSASAVAWEFYYRHLGSPGDAPGDWVGPVSGTIAAGDQSVSNQHVLSSFGDVDMTGKRESTCIAWQIRRQGGTDDDNGTARLIEFDIHYFAVKCGTPSPFPTA